MPSFVSYAQNFEDVMLWRALKHVESGFYIDVGANDPTLDSVTKAFYARCWHGINIEPTVFYFERLAHERPADINLRVAAGAERGTLTLHEVAQTGLSTTQPDVAAQHRREGYDVLCHEVETLPLDEICATYVTGDIHFLKIDVEGGEHDVLRGLDLARWRPWILVIEATRPMSQDETYQEWEPILLSHRYGFAYADGLNRFYVADEHPELMPAFRYPPNVFDGFSSNTHEASYLRMQESDARAARSRQALIGEIAVTRAAEARVAELAQETARLTAVEADLHAAIARAEDAERRHHEAEQRGAVLEAQAAALAETGYRDREEAAERNARLAAEIEAARAERAELSARLAAEIEAGRATSELLRQRDWLLDATLRSHSWRITAPIRALSKALYPRRDPASSKEAAKPVSPVPREPRKLSGPTLFIECTHTYHSDVNTGIQRVVRNVLRHSPLVAKKYGYQVVPVIIENGQFFCADAHKVLQDKQRLATTPAPQAEPDPTPSPKLHHRFQRLLRPVWHLALKTLALLLPFEAARRFIYAPPYQFGLAQCLLIPWFIFSGRKPPPPPAAKSPEVTGGISLEEFANFEGSILLLLDSSWSTPVWPAVARFKEHGGRVAGVIYDLIPITHSSTCVAELVVVFTEWMRNHLYYCDGSVCISRSVAGQLADFIQSRPETREISSRFSIDHFHLGSELDFISPTDRIRPEIGEIFDNDKQIFLMVGSIEPRKNHVYALDAFDLFWQQGGIGSLVIIGRQGWKTERLLERIYQHEQFGRQLFLLRDATDAELDHGYRNASALVIPSVIEGFGLPIVESFQRGLPILCSDIPVFREIADGKATFFDLADPNRLAEALHAFCRDHAAQDRRLRKPQKWLNWRESTEQLISAVMRGPFSQQRGHSAERSRA